MPLKVEQLPQCGSASVGAVEYVEIGGELIWLDEMCMEYNGGDNGILNLAYLTSPRCVELELLTEGKPNCQVMISMRISLIRIFTILLRLFP